MKKAYQTTVDKNHGNCMQAAIASLFELELDQVPNFIEYKDTWTEKLLAVIRQNNCTFDGTLYNINCPHVKQQHDRFNEIKDMPGVKGYFYAGVLSPTYYTSDNWNKQWTTHAVIIDKQFNIVHPVNKSYVGIKQFPEAQRLGYNGIIDIAMINKN